MSLRDDVRTIELIAIDGSLTTLEQYDGQTVLIVNVASKCGLTPQYAQLEELHTRYAGRGFTVLGFPCNQFLGQEPGTEDEILAFCSTTYGVTFPMMAKIKVNGRDAHPLYQALKKIKDGRGLGGPVAWNFEKFLLTSNGEVFRFRPQTLPDAPEIVAAIEASLGASAV